MRSGEAHTLLSFWPSNPRKLLQSLFCSGCFRLLTSSISNAIYARGLFETGTFSTFCNELLFFTFVE